MLHIILDHYIGGKFVVFFIMQSMKSYCHNRFTADHSIGEQ